MPGFLDRESPSLQRGEDVKSLSRPDGETVKWLDRCLRQIR